MRFKAFLTEGAQFSFEDAVKRIGSECKEFLQYSGGFPIYRGMYNNTDDKVTFFNHPEKRKPKDSDTRFNFMFNAMIELAFDISMIRTKSLFVSGNSKQALNYGDLFYCFPAGQLRYLWSPEVVDAYEDDREMFIRIASLVNKETGLEISDSPIKFTDIKRICEILGDIIEPSEWVKGHKDAEKHTLQTFRYVTNEKHDIPNIHDVLIDAFTRVASFKYQGNTGLKAAIVSGNELMIYKSDGYYMVERDLVWKIAKEEKANIENRYDAALYSFLLDKIRVAGA